MPLNPVALKTRLQTFFEAPPPTAPECAAKWADAMQAYSIGIVPPSVGISSAVTALTAALGAAFTGPPPSVVASVEAAFLAFATAVGVGMAPAFTGVPPVVPVGFALELAKAPSQWAQTHEAAATLWANKIDTWMRTGTAVLVAPPFTVTPWS
jgi:hypothetical protein